MPEADPEANPFDALAFAITRHIGAWTAQLIITDLALLSDRHSELPVRAAARRLSAAMKAAGRERSKKLIAD